MMEGEAEHAFPGVPSELDAAGLYECQKDLRYDYLQKIVFPPR